MYVCVYELLILFLFHLPVIVKINIIVHLVFVAIHMHEKEISVSSAELLSGDPQLYLLIKLLTIGLALNSIEFSRNEASLSIWGILMYCHMPFNLLDVFFILPE